MCQFNILLTEKSTSNEMLQTILEGLSFGYNEIENKYMCNQIVGLEKVIMTTKGHCDCGSILGIEQSPSSQRIDELKERKKLRKKKWSESKIDRYLEDKLKSQTRNEENEELGNKTEEERWLKLIHKLTDENIKFGLFQHQFSGSLVNERVNLVKTRKVRIGEFTIEDLRKLEDCEFIRITK